MVGGPADGGGEGLRPKDVVRVAEEYGFTRAAVYRARQALCEGSRIEWPEGVCFFCAVGMASWALQEALVWAVGEHVRAGTVGPAWLEALREEVGGEGLRLYLSLLAGVRGKEEEGET